MLLKNEIFEELLENKEKASRNVEILRDNY